MRLKRQEAIELLKEIVAGCKSISPNHVSLKTPKEENTVSEGYELHIKDHFDEADLKCIKVILLNHNLMMKKYNGFVAIYKQRNQ